MNLELKEKLEKIALKETVPFCYSCYQEAPTGCCSICHSDDLMKLRRGSGVEYGLEWVVEELLQENLEPVDLEETFEDSVRECYEEVAKVGWMSFDTVTLMKEMDPISWRCALSEFEASEEEAGLILSLDGGSTYYFMSDLESFVAERGMD